MQENNQANRGKYIWWIFLPMIIYMAIQNAIQFMIVEVTLIYSFATIEASSYDDLLTKLLSNSFSQESVTAVYLVSATVTMALFAFLYMKNCRKPGKSLVRGIADNGPLCIAGIVILVLGMQYLTNYLINGLAIMFPSWLDQYNSLLESAGLSDSMSVGMTIYTVILGPIVEEIAYRGLTFKAALKVMDYKWAIFVQALLFGFMHMNWLQGCYAFVFGLVLGYVMYRYDNLLVTMVIHIAFNLMGTYGSSLLQTGDNTLMSFFIWFLGSMIVTYAGLLLLSKAAPGQLVEPTGQE